MKPITDIQALARALHRAGTGGISSPGMRQLIAGGFARCVEGRIRLTRLGEDTLNALQSAYPYTVKGPYGGGALTYTRR